MNLDALQSALRDQQLDGWLFYDHHHRDPIANRILGLDPTSFVSRRWFYFVPAHGEPQKLVHRIESGKLDALPGARAEYSSWQELEAKLEAMLKPATTVAMQYSPRNAIMYVSMVDAGTVELVRSFGKDIRSSANLVSIFEAVLTEAQIATHFEAQKRVDRVLQSAWKFIGDQTRSQAGQTDEMSVVNHILAGFAHEGLFTDHGPNCSAGANSADSHYEPTAATSRPIGKGDFVLIDLWAKLASLSDPKQAQPEAIWYDITWTAVVGRAPTDRETLIFNTVRDARDASIAIIRSRPTAARNQPIAGWQADDASRNVIRAAGFRRSTSPTAPATTSPPSCTATARTSTTSKPTTSACILPNTCFLRRARPLLPHGPQRRVPAVRHPQRGQHDHLIHQSGRYRPRAKRTPLHLTHTVSPASHPPPIMNDHRRISARPAIKPSMRPRVHAWARVTSAVFATIVALTAVTVLVGWRTHNYMLTTVLPGHASMKPNTAICFIAASVGVLFALMPSGSSRLGRILARAAGTITFVLAAASLVEYLTHTQLGIDQFSSPIRSRSPTPAAWLSSLQRSSV